MSSGIGGYYAMRVPGVADPLPDAVFTTAGVDGVCLRYDWRDLEPTQGAFDWTAFDHDVGRALTAGKKFSIGVHTGGLSPAWVYAAGSGVRSISYSASPRGRGGCNDYVAPVPYDAGYAPAYLALLSALSGHLASLGAAPVMVKVTPFNNATEELHLPSSPFEVGSCQSDAQSLWLALGYRPSLVLAAFQTIYDGMAAIFPGVTFSFNTIQSNSFPGIDENGNKVKRSNETAESVIGYALSRTPGLVGVEPTALSNVASPDRLARWAWHRGALVGWETNDHGGEHSAGCPDIGCDAAGYTVLVQRGIATGARFIEIWPADAIAFSDVLVANPLP